MYFTSQKNHLLQFSVDLKIQTDSLQRSMIESDAYLEEHLVEGNIMKRQKNTGDETATTLETRKIHVPFYYKHFLFKLLFHI